MTHDELDLPGVAKFKLGGGHGGHNGLKDIISKLGNNLLSFTVYASESVIRAIKIKLSVLC